MRKISYILLSAQLMLDNFCVASAGTVRFDNTVYGDVFRFYDDVIVDAGGGISADRIEIQDSITIVNNGFIDGDFYICDKCHIYLQNSGDFYSVVNMGAGANLTQLITKNDEISRLNVDGDFDILVQNADNISLRDILSVGAFASKIIFNNSALVLDTSNMLLARGIGPDIELRGELVLYVSDFSDFADTPILRNVAGDGVVSIHADNLDSLYLLQAYMDHGALLMRRIRSTDYARILNNDMGRFINSLRDTAVLDPILPALDRAETMAELYSVIKRSARLNPINMMRPVKIMNAFERMTDTSLPRGTEAMAAPVLILSDDFYLYGLRLGADINISKDFALLASGYAASAAYQDSINDFDADIYGGNIRLKYDDKDTAFADAVIGMSVAKFDSGPVFDGHGAADNPHGVSIYGAVTAGRYYDFMGLKVGPFIGADAEYDKILHQSGFEYSGRLGIGGKYALEVAGLRYDYGVRVFAATDNTWAASVDMAVWSVLDMAGMNISVGVYQDTIGMSYKVSTNVRWMF